MNPDIRIPSRLGAGEAGFDGGGDGGEQFGDFFRLAATRLRQIRSPWLRYGLAAFVVTVIVGLAWWSGRDTALAEGDFAWLVPWLGWGVVILVVVVFGLRVLGRNRLK